MTRRNIVRQFALLLAGALIATTVLAQSIGAPNPQRPASKAPRIKGQGAGKAERKEAPALPLPLPVRVVEDEADAQRARDREKQAAQRESEDLKTQRESMRVANVSADATVQQASAAWMQVVIAAIGTFVATVGTLLLILTYRHTVIGTAAAVASAETAQRALMQGQRAFVVHEPVEMNRVSDGNGNIVEWQFWFPWKNCGQTPAKNCEVHVNSLGLSNKGQPVGPLPKWFSFADLAGPNDQFFLGPMTSRNSGPAIVSIAQMQELLANRYRHYFYGWIKYVDIFDAPHVTRFSVEMVRLTGDPAAKVMPDVQFAYSRTFNSADEHCAKEDRARYDEFSAEDRDNFLSTGGSAPHVTN